MTSLLHTPSAFSPSFISLAQVSSLVFPNSFSGWGPLSQLALLSKFRFSSKSSLQGEGGWEGAGKHLPCPALPPPSLTAYLVPGEPAAGDPIWGKPTPAHSSQERVDVGEKLGVLPASVPTTYSGQGGGSRFGLLLFWWLRRRRRQENSQSRLSPKPAAQSREGPPRSQVRWLPLSVFQGCGRWALTVLPLHPNSFPKVPSSSRGTCSFRVTRVRNRFWPSLRFPASRWKSPEPGQASLAQVHRVCYPHTAVTRSTVHLVTCHHALLPHL